MVYVFIDWDFDDGVFGLVWVGVFLGSFGGICEKSKFYLDGKKKFLNIGIIIV